VAAAEDAADDEAVEEEAAADDIIQPWDEAAPFGSGSSSARLFTGLFEGQNSYVEYVPDPQIAQYILSSRKRRTEAASKQSLPKRRRSTRQRSSTGNVLVGELIPNLSFVVF